MYLVIMKAFIVFSFFIACTLATSPPLEKPDILLVLKSAANTCIKDLGLDEKRIHDTLTEFTVAEDDAQLAEFFMCYYKRMNFLDENNKINFNKVEEVLPEYLQRTHEKISMEAARDAIENCKDTLQESATGQLIIKMRNCVMKHWELH